MFRARIGFLDIRVYMDHRFIVPGKTIIWKDGYIKEENLKENEIGF
ncbi:MAG: hypothetical protein KatS3mg037_0308 [Ignavibacterium sp.]|nr:MAG: hypothetical protein KatS3mg037_0308 [Ignavibacterium sp.]